MNYNIPVSDLLQNEYNYIPTTNTFAVDCKTKLIVYANMPKINANINCFVGKRCYEAFKFRTEICEDCNAFNNNSNNSYSLKCVDEISGNAFASVCKMQNVFENDILLITVSRTDKICEYQKHLKQLAFTDVSLGIKNSTVFFENMQYLLEYKKANGYIVILDIVNYFYIRNTCGKDCSTELLRNFVLKLNKLGLYSSLYRISNKNFGIILENYNRNDVIRLLNLIFASFDNNCLQNKTAIKCSLSAGFIDFPKYASNSSQLIVSIDYFISICEKQAGGYIEFNDSMLAAVTRKNKIVKIINEAVNNNGFEVYFQPIYDVTKKIYNKAEALVRLCDTELGYISPAEFIPIAEETGLIVKIGRFVLESACKKIRELLDSNYIIECINVNVSPVELNLPDYSDFIISLIEKYSIPKGMIELEVTEGVLINSFESNAKVFGKLLENGVIFALDDFGTGYSALSYLMNVPVKTIKIDRSFISQITNSVNSVIVEGVISIAKKLNMSTIAEGVENKSQLDILTKYGCESIQGFYFSKPVPYNAVNASFAISR